MFRSNSGYIKDTATNSSQNNLSNIIDQELGEKNAYLRPGTMTQINPESSVSVSLNSNSAYNQFVNPLTSPDKVMRRFRAQM